MTPGRDASQPHIRLRELELRGIARPNGTGSERVLKAERQAAESEISALVEPRDTIPDGLDPVDGPEEWFERASDTIPAAPMSASPDTLPTLPQPGRMPSFAELSADLLQVSTGEPIRPTVLPNRERGKS